MNKIKNWLLNIIKEAMVQVPTKVSDTVTQSLFAYIGIERMEGVIRKMKEKGIEYTSLAEMYSMVIRENLERGNSDRLNAYYELLPKLDEYKKAFNFDNKMTKELKDAKKDNQ